MKNLRLKRHETFSIREGWLEKGLNIIYENPECFKKDEGPRNFGLGSNMCKSLKYWLIACDIAEFSPDAYLTEFGKLLRKYDPYLEDKFSWFFIHAKLSMNFEDAPVINEIINCNYSKFDKELLINYLKDYFTNNDYEIGAESSLESDVSVGLRSYCVSDNSNPEDNMNCPLSKLGLLKIDQKKNYVKQQPAFSSLHYLVVLYVLQECLRRNHDGVINKTFDVDCNLEDVIKWENNPLKVFNITKSILFMYLDQMKNAGYVNIIKTAGLNTIHFNKILSINEIFMRYFEEK